MAAEMGRDNTARTGSRRIPVSVRVLMIFSGGETRMVKTRDISDDGAFLLMSEPRPAAGSVIQAQVIGLGDGDAPVVELEVCAVEAEGIECRYR